MTRSELMQMAAEKALQEMAWDSIEFLFQPSTYLEMLLRIDFEGMKQKCLEWIGDDSPDAMPYRHRGSYIAMINRSIEVEEFYRVLKKGRNKPKSQEQEWTQSENGDGQLPQIGMP